MTTMHLSALVDLAIGTPEVGCVNHNALYSLLHSILHYTNIANRDIILDEEHRNIFGPRLIHDKIVERYSKDDNKDKRLTIINPSDDHDKSDKEKTRSKTATPEMEESIKEDSKSVGKNVTSETKPDIRLSKSIGDSSNKDSTYIGHSNVPYHQLELKVKDLSQKFDSIFEISSGKDIYQQINTGKKGEKRDSPVQDLWQNIKLEKRISAAEIGIQKLSELIDEFMKNVNKFQGDIAKCQKLIDSTNNKLKDYKDKVANLETFKEDAAAKMHTMEENEYTRSSVTWDSLEALLTSNEADIVKIAVSDKPFFKDEITRSKMTLLSMQARNNLDVVSSQRGMTDVSPAISTEFAVKSGIDEVERSTMSFKYPFSNSPSKNLIKIMKNLGGVITVVEDVCQKQEKIETEMEKIQTSAKPRSIKSPLSREKPRAVTPDDAESLDESHPNAKVDANVLSDTSESFTFDAVIEKLEQLEKDMIDCKNNMQKSSGRDTRVIDKELVQLAEQVDQNKKHFEQTYNWLQKDFISLKTESSELFKRNEEINSKLLDVNNELTQMHSVKADKTEFLHLNETKATVEDMAGKVSNHKFDQANDTVNSALNNILEDMQMKMSLLEWNEALEKLEDALREKMDRSELKHLKTWLDTKLKSLNNKFQKISSEDEAAGLKKQLIQKFHCISCDRPIEMAPTGPIATIPFQGSLVPTKSPRPYTTFELDWIRQHAKSLTGSEMGDMYIIDRACGGSHTLTNPSKRLPKYIYRDEAVVNPKLSSKDEENLVGTDGRIYLGRNIQKIRLPKITKRPQSAPHGRLSTENVHAEEIPRTTSVGNTQEEVNVRLPTAGTIP